MIYLEKTLILILMGFFQICLRLILASVAVFYIHLPECGLPFSTRDTTSDNFLLLTVSLKLPFSRASHPWIFLKHCLISGMHLF